MREAEQDIAEGADMIMVKPGLPYLDIIRRLKDEFRDADLRLSGVGRICDDQGRGATTAGSTARRRCWKALMAFKRAGADGILTYFAPEVARMLKG